MLPNPGLPSRILGPGLLPAFGTIVIVKNSFTAKPSQVGVEEEALPASSIWPCVEAKGKLTAAGPQKVDAHVSCLARTVTRLFRRRAEQMILACANARKASRPAR
jgi:hypothetical protein